MQGINYQFFSPLCFCFAADFYINTIKFTTVNTIYSVYYFIPITSFMVNIIVFLYNGEK